MPLTPLGGRLRGRGPTDVLLGGADPLRDEPGRHVMFLACEDEPCWGRPMGSSIVHSVSRPRRRDVGGPRCRPMAIRPKLPP